MTDPDDKKKFAKLMKEFAANISIGMRIYIEAEVSTSSSVGSTPTELKQTIIGSILVMRAENPECIIGMNAKTYINKNNIII